MQRADYPTLKALGLNDDDIKALDLWEPATASPANLIEAYLRRSKKREDLATMRAHLRDLCRYRDGRPGAQIRHVWFEQLSASKSYVRRPQFEEATQAVFDGLSKTLAFWKTDRFDRRGMGAVGRMLDEFDRRRSGLVSVTEGLDSRQPGARIVFAILSERAREEARDISLRVNIGHEAHRVEGRRGTGVPPYGLTSPRLADGKASGLVAHHPTEFEGARRMADLMLGNWETEEGKPGESLSATATAKRLNAEGHRTRTGVEFTAETVSRISQSPLFGGMVPRTERVMDEHEQPTGQWVSTQEPLLDEKGDPVRCGEGVVTVGEWWRIRAGFKARTAAEGGRGKRGAEYLLTGIVRCHLCKGWMRHHGTTVRGKYINYYRCTNWANKGTCKGTSTRAPRLEHAVKEAWIGYVTSLEPTDPVLSAIGRRWLAFSNPEHEAEKRHATESLKAAQARVQKLEDDYYIHGKMTEERYDQLSKAQLAIIEMMEMKLHALGDTDSDITVLLNSDALREAWEDATMSDRRMLLKSALKAVYVLPAKGRGYRTPIDDRLADWEWVTA